MEVIHMNSASYSAWEWRWRCLEALGGGPPVLAAEARLLADLAAARPKNYQLWNHRRRLALKRGAAHAPEELDFAAACLGQDAKNYHAWAQRQAVVASFGLWAAELAYAEALIAADVRNNSAWNQRWFVVSGAPTKDPGAVLAREVAFAAAQIRRAPHNDSAWAYLRGLPALPGQAAQLAYEPGIPAICLEVLSGDHPSCPPALALLADVYAAQALAARAAGDATASAAARAAARRCFGHLLVADPLRSAYWRHCLAQLKSGAEEDDEA
ncbi:hypothetical protein WJX81_000336 [Elliptochloris bilobata]|uniref:Protein farnesyltransferase/geranylgeranyltransferase type-1 subunit alpha n=1 Tax=Elliptochloris bilobata TaxID=381761 RepID=A0AAW1S4R6_9CHLO